MNAMTIDSGVNNVPSVIKAQPMLFYVRLRTQPISIYPSNFYHLKEYRATRKKNHRLQEELFSGLLQPDDPVFWAEITCRA
jgi:hypothetical protein